MNTSDTARSLQGSVQTPILHTSQLTPGTIITGVYFEYAWEVMEAPDREGIVTIKRLPFTLPVSGHTHTFQPMPTGTLRVCACGYARDTVSAFLPINELQIPRAVALVPLRPVQALRSFTIYLAPSTSAQRRFDIYHTNASSRFLTTVAVPLIPLLHEVWRLPDALQAWLATHDHTVT